MRVDEHTIDLAGSPIFYRKGSSSGAPALYLHGVPTSSDDWIAFLERTGGLAPDLPGFGRSGKSGHLDYSIDGYGRFAQEFLDQLGIKTVRLVAHGWGAVAGLTFAQREPERIERLVLINPIPLFGGFEWHRAARIWRRPVLGELAMGATTKRMLKRTLKRAAPFSEEQIDAVWEQFDQGTQRAILRLHRDASADRLAQAGAHLDRLGVPALVLWGTNDSWLSPEVGETYAASLPSASLEQIPDAGHWPWLDQPGVIERVARFLE